MLCILLRVVLVLLFELEFIVLMMGLSLPMFLMKYLILLRVWRLISELFVKLGRVGLLMIDLLIVWLVVIIIILLLVLVAIIIMTVLLRIDINLVLLLMMMLIIILVVLLMVGNNDLRPLLMHWRDSIVVEIGLMWWRWKLFIFLRFHVVLICTDLVSIVLVGVLLLLDALSKGVVVLCFVRIGKEVFELFESILSNVFFFPGEICFSSVS